MTLERDLEAVARGLGDDFAMVGREIVPLLLRSWPILLPAGIIAAIYFYLALRTSAGWTGAAIFVGIGAVIAAVVAGPSLRHRYRQSLLRNKWHNAVSEVGLSPTTVERVDLEGRRLTVRVGKGDSVDEIRNKVKKLEASLGERLRIDPDHEHPGRADIVFSHSEVFTDRRAWPGIADHEFSLWDPIPFGLDEDGNVVGISLVQRHMLIGGMSGGGKSVAVSAICAAAANDPDTRLYLLDPKRLELAIWKQCAEGFAGGPDIDRATELLREVRRELNRRTTLLEAKTQAENIPARMITRDPSLPLYLVVIDELAEYTDRGRESQEFSTILRSLVSMGRAVGIIIVAATQKPQGSVVPTELRDLFQYRFALRCGTPQMSDTVLGMGWASRGADASRLRERPGLGFLLANEALPRQVRTFFLSDDDLASLALRARERRTNTISLTGGMR